MTCHLSYFVKFVVDWILMEEIIKPVAKHLLLEELTNDKLVRKTNRNSNYIYSVSASDAPNVMLEIGRLREISYRSVGSGTGKNADIDTLDRSPKGYKQLIVFDRDKREILGGYRYLICAEAERDENGFYQLGTSRLFKYSEEFIRDYLPYTIELGRSFIQPEYQSTRLFRKSMYVMDNLWDGLGSLLVQYPETRYFLGQVSIYTDYHKKARDLILYFLQHFFPDPDGLVKALNPVEFHHPIEEIQKVFTGKNRKENYRILSKQVRKLNHVIPPLINSYINLSATMRTFGTILNPYFKNMEDTGLLVSVNDIYAQKKNRHLIGFSLKKP